MNKLLIIKNFIIKNSDYLFKLVMKVLFFPFELIIECLDVILTELGKITFRDIVKFILVYILVKFGATLLRLIFGFILVFGFSK